MGDRFDDMAKAVCIYRHGTNRFGTLDDVAQALRTAHDEGAREGRRGGMIAARDLFISVGWGEYARNAIEALMEKDDGNALRSLYDRVSKATGPDREMDCAIAVGCDGYVVLPPRSEEDGPGYGRVVDGVLHTPGQSPTMLVPKYTASLDAVEALRQRVLPEYEWFIERERDLDGTWAFNAVVQNPDWTNQIVSLHTHVNAACALLLGALAALISKEESACG